MTTGAIAERTAPARADVLGTIARAMQYDLSRPFAFAVLAVAYVASRAPFVNIGYGTDPDAWRVGLSGYWLWEHGEYYPSRLPGYPLPELASALAYPGGWLASNLLTVAISLLGVWFFARIVRHLEIPNGAVIVVAFAFTPLLWINSMTTMDYMWALTFILGSYYFLLLDRNFTAALLLGLAVASRLSSGMMLIPFGLYLWRSNRTDEIRSFAVTAVAVALLWFSPIIWRYGPSFLNFYDSPVGYMNVIRLLGKDTLGLIGSISVLIAAAVSLPRLLRLPGDAIRDKNVMVWALAVGLTVFTFFRLPHEPGYLIPVYPFAFFVMAKYFHRWVLAGAVAAILFAGFIDLSSRDDDITVSALLNARIGEGLILSNRTTMNAQVSFVREMEDANVEPRSVVMMGFIYPHFAFLNRHDMEIGILEEDHSSISQLSDKGMTTDPATGTVYVWLLDYDDFERFRREGRTFWYTIDAGRSTAWLYGFRPALYGANLLDLGRAPSGGSAGGRTER
jgi:hypothetical protein